jgi:alanyl-tRNA synthetase
MTFLCGGRALLCFQRLQSTVDAIARRFSTGGEEVLSAVERQEAELKELKKEKAALTARLEEYLTGELKTQAEDVKGKKLLVRLTDTDPKRLRELKSGVNMWELYNDMTEYATHNSDWKDNDSRRGYIQREALNLLMSKRDIRQYQDIFAGVDEQ